MNTLKKSWRMWPVALAVLIGTPAGNIWADGQEGEVSGSRPPRTEAVKRGDIDLSIHAEGTLEPEETVDVGAQVAGTITKFGDDPAQPDHRIGWNSKVAVGTVLAYIDDTTYKTARDIAKITLRKSRASLIGTKVSLDKALAEFERDKVLDGKQAIAQADLDTARFAVEMAKSNVEMAQAQVELDELALKQAETNLDRTRIKSPTDGIVIDRRANIGSAVSESLSAPSLFLIATDLAKLQIWMSINEANISQIHEGQSVRFSVDAIADKVFEGRIIQIRLNATIEKNVVTYTVVVSVDNAKRDLRPYETATATIESGSRKNVLMVPNAALDFSPRTGGLPPFPIVKPRSRVWVIEGKSMRPIDLKLGVTDGSMTEVVDGEIKDGMQVAVATPEVQRGR